MNDIPLLQNNHPSRADAVKNRELLLETARLLFAEHGVEAVSMSAIAEAAHVGKGTLYRHFESKAALCYALLDHEQRELQERTFTRLRTVTDPLDNLRWFLGQVLDFVWEHAPLLCEATHHERQRTLVDPAHWWWRQTIGALLARSVSAKDIDYMADVLYIMLDAHTIWFQHQSLGYDKTRIVDGLLGVLAEFVD
jgi:AcrR family transcriptional regulator